jgi:CBS domain-containing protein
MTQNPVVVKEDTYINEVIELILQKHIILVPVINDQQRLVGVVSRVRYDRENLTVASVIKSS